VLNKERQSVRGIGNHKLDLIFHVYSCILHHMESDLTSHSITYSGILTTV